MRSHPLLRAAPAFLTALALLAATDVGALTPGGRQTLFGAPGWVFPGASIDMNFAQAQYYGLQLGSLAVSRASVGTCPDQNGNYYQFGSNNPRVCPGTGLWVEEGRTNSIRNNTMQGAAVGTPGTAPTDWGVLADNVSLTASIAALGTYDGMSCIDETYSGTASGAGVIGPGFETTTGVTASYGQTWSLSVSYSISGGSTSNISGGDVWLGREHVGGLLCIVGHDKRCGPSRGSDEDFGFQDRNFANRRPTLSRSQTERRRRRRDQYHAEGLLAAARTQPEHRLVRRQRRNQCGRRGHHRFERHGDL